MRTRSLLALVLLLPACAQEPEAVPPAVAGVDDAVWANYQPLPDSMPSADNPVTPEKVALGRMLYYDTRFSTTKDISCYVCHPLHDYGTSHRSAAIGHGAKVGTRNEPTVYNAAGQFAQFWDGRVKTVEEQALGPVLNKVEMGMATKESVIKILKSMPGYQEAFHKAFPGEEDPVTFENFGKAIGAFERGLLTPSRWDEFLNGNPEAITAEEKAGFGEFVSAGCATCHTGPFVGGNMYQKVGVIQPWFNGKDLGRFQVTGIDADKMIFKVPSLRNIEETWPYFHDGSVQRLEDAVYLMASYQLGRPLNLTQIGSIRTWLKTLTGTVNVDYINEPVLPPNPATQE